MNVVQFLFEKSAELNKDFVLGNKETISYKCLYERSSKMASYLSNTFGTNNNILLVSNNNSFFLICYLGIMQSGNVCVPLNPSTEPENFEFIVHQTEGVACFIEKRISGKLASHSLITITDEEYLNLITNQPNFKIPDFYNSELPAQIIFTSGSTSQPKGVVLSHKNIISNTSSIVEYLNLSEKDIVEVVLPFYYCYGLSLLHTHLRVGGSIVLNNNFVLIGKVLNDINRFKCTGFAGVPSHFQILLRKSDNFKNTELSSLRYVTQAGGKLHNCFIKEFIQYFPGIDFYVMYGQTEATARLSYFKQNGLDSKLGSIGKGIPNVELKVVNQIGEHVQPGESGEIIAKGDNIMIGYYKDVEGTDNVIRNGWLYTGDLGTIDNDGNIYLTARKKEIIKIFGNRVSLKEIEEVIVSFPDVVDCTAEIIEDNVTGEAIKVVVEIKESAKNRITDNILRSYCVNKLALYKIPKVIEFTQKLKINSAGKKVKSIKHFNPLAT